MGGDIGGDTVGDAGSADVSADKGSDFGDDLASESGTDLSSDYDSDVGSDTDTDLDDEVGQYLNSNDFDDGSSDAIESDSLNDPEMDPDDDLNVNLDDNGDGDIPIEDENADNIGEDLNEIENDDILEIEDTPISDEMSEPEPDIGDESGSDLNSEIGDTNETESDDVEASDIGEDLNEEPADEIGDEPQDLNDGNEIDIEHNDYAENDDVNEPVEDAADTENANISDETTEAESDTDDTPDDPPKVLERDADELAAIRDSTIENNMEAERDNLRDHGMQDGEEMESIIDQKRQEATNEFNRDAFGDNKAELTSDDVLNKDNDDSVTPDFTPTELQTERDGIQQGISDDAASLNGKFTEQTDAPYQGEELRDNINLNEHEIPDSAFDSVPNDRREAVTDAFENASDDIKDVVSDYGSDLNVDNTEGDDCCHYNLNDKTIRMEDSMDDGEYAEVFTHEYGHFADDQMGWPSKSEEFVNAVSDDKGLYDRSTPEGRERFDGMMNDAFSSGAAYDRMVSDNLSALFQNDPEVIDYFNGEGVPYYQHSNEYWNNGLNRENEIFANSFSIRSGGDVASSDFINKHMPNTSAAFDNLIKSRRGV